jgi:anti-anti-sigma factor
MILAEAVHRYNEAHPLAPVTISRPQAEAVVLGLAGELEMKSSSELGPVLEAALLVTPPRGRLILDLGGLSYVSSTGVGLLVSTMVNAGKRSIALVLRNTPPRVLSVMDLLGFVRFFAFEESDDRS